MMYNFGNPMLQWKTETFGHDFSITVYAIFFLRYYIVVFKTFIQKITHLHVVGKIIASSYLMKENKYFLLFL